MYLTVLRSSVLTVGIVHVFYIAAVVTGRKFVAIALKVLWATNTSDLKSSMGGAVVPINTPSAPGLKPGWFDIS
jgi:hypothetical protein